MLRHARSLLLFGFGLFGASMGSSMLHAAEPDLIPRLAQRIDAWHRDSPSRAPIRLRVVYFHAADTPPLADYEARCQRYVTDILDFYAAEFERHGLPGRQIPVEMAGDQPRLWLLQGQLPAADYHYDEVSSEKIRSEIAEAFSGEIHLEHEFVLVICGLCREQENGVFVFDSPYFGKGGSCQKWGLCFAADGPMLDTKNYAVEDRRIAYREHLGRFNRTLGMLCRLYIGGTAHELGHALGLPHNEATPSEGFRWGVALMGSGNFAWRGEQVGKPGAFLTTASVARLLSHPLMTQSNRQRFAPTLAEMDQVHFAARADGGIHLSGSVLADPPAYALIADTDPEGGANYDSHTWTAAVNEQGHFSLDITTLRSVPQELRLTVCHLNGGSSTVIRLPFGPRADADAMAADLTSTLSWRQAEADYLAGKKDRAAARCQQALPQATASIAPRLQHMLKLARGQAATQPLSVLEGDEIHLADVTPELADVGWGAPRRNECYNPPGINQGVCLIVGGAFYSSGLYAHSPSKLRYSLDGTWHRFEATVGLQQGAHQVGTGVFIVRGDGKELARVGPLRMDESAKIQADITGVRQLELVTEPDGESNASSWTVWAAPRLMR